jgi:hypothetical protein
MKSVSTALERRPRTPRSSAEGPSPSSTNQEPTAVDADGDTAIGPKRRYKEVWLVEDRREGKSIWTRVGVAFENADGSFNIRLSALPIGGGRLNMRDPLEREPAPQVAA